MTSCRRPPRAGRPRAADLGRNGRRAVRRVHVADHIAHPARLPGPSRLGSPGGRTRAHRLVAGLPAGRGGRASRVRPGPSPWCTGCALCTRGSTTPRTWGSSGLLLGPVLRLHARTATTRSTTSRSTRAWATAPTSTRSCRTRPSAAWRVMLDGVFNHVGREHPLAPRGVTTATAVAPARWFETSRRRRPPDGLRGPRRPRRRSTTPTSGVAGLVVDVMRHWLRRGIAAGASTSPTPCRRSSGATVLATVRERVPRRLLRRRGDPRRLRRDRARATGSTR